MERNKNKKLIKINFLIVLINLGCEFSAFFKISANVLRLCEEADFGAQNFQHSTKVDAR